jgi:MerR family redox-sensitive transcriptional activator SoxR
MKIGDLARRSGLNSSSIRYYESLGILAPARRVAGQRRYSTDDVHRVLLIRFASEMGFTLSEIKVFLNGLRDEAPVGPRWRRLAQRKIREVEETIQQSRRLKLLLQHLLGCSCASLQVCVQHLSLSSNLGLLGHRGKTRSGKVRRRSRDQV